VPPLGYRSVAAEERGTKIKKTLEVDPVEADTVRLIFDPYRKGLRDRWPLGIKEVVKVLNSRWYRTRSGALFGVGPTHNILTARHYATGLYPYGVTDSKTGEANAPEMVVHIPIPAIVDLTIFDEVQALLAWRNPPCHTTPRDQRSLPPDRHRDLRLLWSRDDPDRDDAAQEALFLLHLRRPPSERRDGLPRTQHPDG